VQRHRRTENGEAPGWQGATTENIGNTGYLLHSGDPNLLW
jgi:hypothetical protein